jgi:toxin HigB-1
MIRGFRSRALKRFYERGESRHISAEHRETLRDILARLDASVGPEDMSLPGFRLHPLKGDLAGFWAVTVRANWRVIFRFEDGDAIDVDYLDYH